MRIPAAAACFLLLGSSIPASGQRILETHLRCISIGKMEVEADLEATLPPPEGVNDGALFDQLMTDVAAGRAWVLSDQETVLRAGSRGSLEAARDYPAAGPSFEAPPEEVPPSVLPPGFNSKDSPPFRFSGQQLTAEFIAQAIMDPGTGRVLQDLNLNVSRRSRLHIPRPAAAVPSGGHLPWDADFSGTVTQKTLTQALTWTGKTLLISIAPLPGTRRRAEGPLLSWQFIRAGLRGETPAPAEASSGRALTEQRLLHAVTLRLSRHDAAAALLESGLTDATLYSRIRALIPASKAALTAHGAVLCRQYQRSSVESFTEAPGARDSEPLPTLAPNPDFPGDSMEVESDPSNPGKWQIKLKRRDAYAMLPPGGTGTNAPADRTAAPFPKHLLNGNLIVPSSGILLAGVASTSPATDGAEASSEKPAAGAADLTFLIQIPPPQEPPPERTRRLQPRMQLQAMILSLPADNGAPLATSLWSAGAPIPAELAVSRFLTGEIWCPAHAALALTRGNWSDTSVTRQVPGGNPFLRPGPVLSPGRPQTPVAGAPQDSPPPPDCGLGFTAHFMSGDQEPVVNLTWEWDTAPLPALPETSAFSAPGAPRCRQKVVLRNISLQRGKPVIADVRASNAREGTPEHGRWHALVLLAR